jgi:hypothetical protein
VCNIHGVGHLNRTCMVVESSISPTMFTTSPLVALIREQFSLGAESDKLFVDALRNFKQGYSPAEIELLTQGEITARMVHALPILLILIVNSHIHNIPPLTFQYYNFIYYLFLTLFLCRRKELAANGSELGYVSSISILFYSFSTYTCPRAIYRHY